jgi:hypothetical protein
MSPKQRNGVAFAADITTSGPAYVAERCVEPPKLCRAVNIPEASLKAQVSDDDKKRGEQKCQDAMRIENRVPSS